MIWCRRSKTNIKPADSRKLLKIEAKIGMAEGREDDAAQSLMEIVTLDPLHGDSLILLGQYF
ncbi:MAG: hypothetical protein RL015_653 [Verrucomicrobiota bacterium]